MNFTIDPNATAHPEDLQFNGNGNNGGNSGSATSGGTPSCKKRDITKTILEIVLVLIVVVGAWFSSRAYYAERQLQLSVPGDAKVYPADADMEVVEGPNGTTSFYFYDVAIRFKLSNKQIDSYSESDEALREEFYREVKFPMKLDANGFYHLEDGRTIWLVKDVDGKAYQVLLP